MMNNSTLSQKKTMLLQFGISKNKQVTGKNNLVLAGDIGATKTNLALFKVEGENMISLRETQYKSNDYKNIIELTSTFIKNNLLPDSICFGVAGPVLNGHANLSNIKWEIDSNELSGHFGIKKVCLINDLEATAYGLAMLNEKDVTVIHKGNDDT